MFHERFLPCCVICNETVNLEESKADEHGRAVHENCYIFTVMLKKSPQTHSPNLGTISERLVSLRPCGGDLTGDVVLKNRPFRSSRGFERT
jgi:hypothetical protein